ncbi:hypothetical protein D0962_22795 [Leptolyngbyaceae cyanobacterium CCMR0082]|uniref:Uncharacterized protein n=1 Tax=Adonisia turfae CCMR0082 TaxID=2304604 RepID=A0A6M0SAL7_9CYAN|nr:hypothetical protein [Adonisia turfae]NEZ65549.1 hypothetical protein [Adonisia turfae CCMR0082]
MAYDHDNAFYRKWLIQASAGLDVALDIPAEAYIQTPHPVDDEWAAIDSLKTPLGLSAADIAVIDSSPFLRLHPSPDSTFSNDGNEAAYREAAAGTIYQPGSVRRRFEINVRDARTAISDAVRRIAELSNFGTPGQQVPVLILDFCFPEVGDKTVAIAQNQPAYTVRKGLISSVSIQGPDAGYPGSTRVNLGNGFSFTFAESILRRAV